MLCIDLTPGVNGTPTHARNLGHTTIRKMAISIVSTLIVLALSISFSQHMLTNWLGVMWRLLHSPKKGPCSDLPVSHIRKKAICQYQTQIPPAYVSTSLLLRVPSY